MNSKLDKILRVDHAGEVGAAKIYEGQLKVQPYIPSEAVLKNNGRSFPPNFLHETWMDFLYWDTELLKN